MTSSRVADAMDGLKSREAQDFSETVAKLQREYTKAVASLAKAQSAVAKVGQAEDQEKILKAAQQELQAHQSLSQITSLFYEAAKNKQQYISELNKSVIKELKVLESTYEIAANIGNQQSQAAEQALKKRQMDLSLITAALSDITTIISELEKNKQVNYKRNPALTGKAGSPATINKQKLAEEIVAVLAEADKVKTSKIEGTAGAAKEVKTTAKVSKTEAKKPVASSAGRYRLKTLYSTVVVDKLMKEFGYKNINEVPKVDKILLNMGLGDVKDDSKKFAAAVEELKTISGQKPIVTKAKKSIANFKVREGMNLGAKVTMRGKHMYEWLDKLISVALPRVRDFKGVNPHSFDGRGNYAMGIKEQLIFPEIKYEKIEKIRGFDVCIVTTAKTDEEAKALLKAMGMPFRS